MVIIAVQFSPETYPESRIYGHLACWGDKGNTRERSREGNREGNIANEEVVAETAVTKVTQEVWDRTEQNAFELTHLREKKREMHLSSPISH